MDLLRDPVWQFVGAVLGLLALIVTLVIYFRQRQVARLAWYTPIPPLVLDVNDYLRGRLKILVDDHPQERLHIILLRLINSGTLPIRPADYERPIQFVFGAKAILLTATVSETSQSSLQATIQPAIDSFTLTPVLLNSGDWIEFKVLVSQFDGPIQVEGRIAGVPAIVRSSGPITAWNSVMFAGCGVIGLSLIGGVASLLGAAIPPGLVAILPLIGWIVFFSASLVDRGTRRLLKELLWDSFIRERSRGGPTAVV